MDWIHIKLFGHSKEVFSILYLINRDHRLSCFVKVIDNQKMLNCHGTDPAWIKSVIKIQETDLTHAKKYALYKIKETVEYGHHISVEFSGDQSNFHHDGFINEIIKLSELNDVNEDKDL